MRMRRRTGHRSPIKCGCGGIITCAPPGRHLPRIRGAPISGGGPCVNLSMTVGQWSPLTLPVARGGHIPGFRGMFDDDDTDVDGDRLLG